MSTQPLPVLAYFECDERAIDEFMRVMNEAFDPDFGEAWSEAQCLSIFSYRGVWGVVARFDGEVAGFALARLIVDASELLLLGVRPGFRRMGIGRGLLREVQSGAKARGARRLHLEVREGNMAGDLYTQEGFRPVGRRRDYYRGTAGAQFDAITLALDIGGHIVPE